MIQKRRKVSSKQQVLPMTRGVASESIRRQGDGHWSIIVLIVVTFALLLFVGRSLLGTSEIMMSVQEQALPLSEFETVNNALEHVNLVGIYFAASWCPMSTPITNQLEEYFSSVPNLLYNPGESKTQKHEFAIVNVSSDTSQSAMEDYLRPGWIGVPFDSTETVALKKHFSVCAKREMAALGFERKFEIPTLIILDGESHGTITTNGVYDLEVGGSSALDRWIYMQTVIRGLESKYQ